MEKYIYESDAALYDKVHEIYKTFFFLKIKDK